METKKLIMLIILFVIMLYGFASIDTSYQVIISLIMTFFIIPGFILYKLFGKIVAIGYVLLVYVLLAYPFMSKDISTSDDKELNKSRIYAVLIGIAIFYVLNKYLK